MTKGKILILVLIAGLLFFGLSLATDADKKVKVFNPWQNLIDKDDIEDLIVGKVVYKRVIGDDLDEDDIELFKNKGCLIKHRLKDLASFECPEEVVPELKVREARIFQILDLEADEQIKADQVWAEGINGEGVNVVILDTGIDTSHIELSDSILGCENFVTEESCEDLSGHGTNVAGIITANGIYQVDSNYATGVAPGAGIYMLKVCNVDGLCYEDDMIAAMEYAVNNLDAEIMSISIGGGDFGSHCDSDPLAAKVNWVADNGFTVAVAVGNEGSGVSSPACASKVIAVGAVNKKGIVPYWSNKGTALDIVAPGVDILSTYSCLAAGDCDYHWYSYMSGTSMSAPHVSGVTALLLQAKPTASTNEIKDALYTTADPATGCQKCRFFWRGRCYGQKIVECAPEDEGAGIVNAYEAYLAIKTAGPECEAGQTRQCGETDLGECQYGSQICSVEGAWGECIGAIYPIEEICDDIDNDCDGLIDEEGVCGAVMCWSKDFQYLYRKNSQAKKFCKCSQGTYGYNSYSRKQIKATIYYYLDAKDNENWEVSSRTSYRPIYEVTCSDGEVYSTNQDYYYPK